MTSSPIPPSSPTPPSSPIPSGSPIPSDSSATPDAGTPTEAEVYAAYQTLLDTLNAETNSCTDPVTVQLLNQSAQAVSDFLTEENEVALQASTAAFTALTPQMKKANDQLTKLKAQIAAIATRIANADKVLGAIADVLQIASKF
jgi:hypothetical protein